MILENLPPGMVAQADQEMAQGQKCLDELINTYRQVHAELIKAHADELEIVSWLVRFIEMAPPEFTAGLLALAVDRLGEQRDN